MITTRWLVVDQRGMDALYLTFQNRAFPHASEYLIGGCVSCPLDDILNHVNFLSIRKKLRELFIRGLEDAEGRVQCAIDDQYVLHGNSTPIGEVRCRTEAIDDEDRQIGNSRNSGLQLGLPLFLDPVPLPQPACAAKRGDTGCLRR